MDRFPSDRNGDDGDEEGRRDQQDGSWPPSVATDPGPDGEPFRRCR
jgi:hypothetical protein